MSNTASGACLCGDFSYTFDRDCVVSAHHCHCIDCQKITGSGKATIVMVPTAALKTHGELQSFTVTGTDGGHVTRCFCPRCGSQLLSHLEEMSAMRFVKAGTLQDSSWLKIDSSFWRCTAQHWSPVDDRYPACDKNPDLGG
jgi:hypothetical protein